MGGAEESDANQEYGETSGEEEESDIVQLFDLLPARLLKVVLWARRREVADKGANQADSSVDDGDVVAPSPGRLEIELCGNEAAHRAPGDSDAELGPTNANTSIRGRLDTMTGLHDETL